MGRFYDKATVSVCDGIPGHWNVLLDGKKVKTPKRDPLMVPGQMLAMAIAYEFQMQSADLVRPITQPLFRLQWQAQDASFTPDELVARMLQHVDADPTCMRNPVTSASKRLRQRQDEVLTPIQDWANARFGIQLRTHEELMTVRQDPDVSFAFAHFLSQLPYPKLLALTELAGACKSLLIAFALNDDHLTIDQAIRAARLEEDVQMEMFGLVEGGHDVDAADLRTRVSGSSLFLSLLHVDGQSTSVSAEQMAIRRDVGKAMDTLDSLGF